ncbi:hypothetical protein CYY_003585 [Polysphondylium violaceum]|uniref:Uncharacterized protein n=1 Tax=Polysphondylium violaceum TaxID=133409 RepID=A0A8J4PUI1_9MYCE|nr:hypothetical protein CYY_003585 [Polysphondylium violaceum]
MSSQSYFLLIKSLIRIVVAVGCALVVSYINFAIVQPHAWASIFISFTYVFLSSGFFLTSQRLPYTHGKVGYLALFCLTYFFRPENYSPVPYLKFWLTSIVPIPIIIVTGIICNIHFSSRLFLDSCTQALKTSRKLFKVINRELEYKTLEFLDFPVESTIQKYILWDTQHRILDFNDIQGKTDLTLQHEQEDELNVQQGKHHTSIPEIQIIKDIENNVKTEEQVDKQKDTETDGKEKVRKINLEKLLKSHLYFKDSLEKLNVEYSRTLNRMEVLLKETLKEFWNKDFFSFYKEISWQLEKNHRHLFTIRTAAVENLSKKSSHKIFHLLPYINTLIHQSYTIFRIMEKQLSKKYKPANFKKNHMVYLRKTKHASEEDLFDQVDLTEISTAASLESSINRLKYRQYKTLEYSQFKILICFETISKTIDEMNAKYSELHNPENYTSFDTIEEDSRVSFLLRSIKKFSKEQKLLSSTVFLLSLKLWSDKRPQKIRMIASYLNHIKLYFTEERYKRKLQKENRHSKYRKEFPDIIQPHFSLAEKAKYFYKTVILTRFLKFWRFQLQLSLGFSVFSLVYYELKIHSNFILFRNLGWAVITFTLINAPSIGAIGFLSIARLGGTIAGSFLGYASAELYSLTVDPGRDFIFLGVSMVLVFFFSMITIFQPFDKFILYFILTYIVIAYLPYPTNNPDIIISLFRTLHITFGIILVLVLSTLINPYYDHQELEKKVYTYPTSITQSFNFLVSNELIGRTNVAKKNLTSFYRASRFSAIQRNIPSFLTKAGFKFLMSEQLNTIRHQLPVQRALLFNSRFELYPFQLSKFKELQEIVKVEARLYSNLINLEFIIVERNENEKIKELSERCTPNLIKLMSEIDNGAQYLVSLMRSNSFTVDSSNNIVLQDPVVSENCSLELTNEIIKDISAYIYENRYNKDVLNKLQHISAIVFTLKSFVKTYDQLLKLLIKFSNTLVLKRVDNNNHNNDNDTKPTTTTLENDKEKEKDQDDMIFNSDDNFIEIPIPENLDPRLKVSGEPFK